MANARKHISEVASERWEDERSARSWASYADSVAPDKRRWLEVIVELAGDSPQRVLDVGTGAGMLALLYAELGHRTTGLDFSEAMLEEARKRRERSGLSCEFAWGNAEDLPFESGAFDVVSNRIMLWSLPNPGVAVREWARVLKPGGRIVIFGNHPNHPPAPSPLAAATRLLEKLLAAPTRRFAGHDDEFWKSWRRRARSELPFHHAPAPKVKALLDAAGLVDTLIVPLADRIGETRKTLFRMQTVPWHAIVGTKPVSGG